MSNLLTLSAKEQIATMNAARAFPENTCPASRHVAMIAAALLRGEVYPMLAEEPEYCGQSLAATVTGLWNARTAAARMVTDVGALVEASCNLAAWCCANHYWLSRDETLGALLVALDAAISSAKGSAA